VYPTLCRQVMIADKRDPLGDEYGRYFSEGCHPSGPRVVVNSVELKLQEHLDRQGLGAPVSESVTVAAVLEALTKNQGGFVQGEGNNL